MKKEKRLSELRATAKSAELTAEARLTELTAAAKSAGLTAAAKSAGLTAAAKATTQAMSEKRRIELLAPARDAGIARAALLHGADAVYLGAAHHGARASAGNQLADIARTVELAHRFDARVYVTVNTLVYDNELREVEQLVRELYRVGVDALIVQDMALLRLDLPPIALHASTQADIRTPERARFLADAGFSQLVIAREATLEEIRNIAGAVPEAAIESFCHGALCVSYSGDCQASLVSTGRSANRGECAQICRLPFTLTDADGREIIRDRHLLSLRDLNRAAAIPDMLDAGVTSFKIEGRLKDEAYVKNTVAAYRAIIDRAIAREPERYRRLSAGTSELTFEPDLARSFNRGYTSYFLTPRPKEPMGSHLSPKSIGNAVGKVRSAAKGKSFTAQLDTPLSNGDGLTYIAADGTVSGFRLNRIDGNRLTAATAVDIPAGTTLWRNRDKAWDDIMAGETARRTIAVDLTLRMAGETLVLDATDETGLRVSATLPLPEIQEARTPQEEARKRVLGKTGGTIYRVNSIDDRAGNVFIAASALTDLRRRTLDLLDRTRRATHPFELRREEKAEAKAPRKLTYHDNVANRLARQFYTDHGAKEIAPALETDPDTRAAGGLTVMTTRYCLRRELGACLRTPAGKNLPDNLRLRAPGIDFRLEFDCRECRMKVIKD